MSYCQENRLRWHQIQTPLSCCQNHSTLLLWCRRQTSANIALVTADIKCRRPMTNISRLVCNKKVIQIRSPKDPFLIKGCSQGKYPVTWEPKGVATVLYEPAKAGCIRLLAAENLQCSTRFAHRVCFLHVKSTVASGQKPVGVLAHTSTIQLCYFEQPIAPSTWACMAWCGCATTGCKMMLFSLQKSTISCEVDFSAVSIRKLRGARPVVVMYCFSNLTGVPVPRVVQG